MSTQVICPHCNKSFASRGIAVHIERMHGTSEQKAKYSQGHNGKYTQIAQTVKNKGLIPYNENPKQCLNCSEIIPYEKKANKFCCSSCSATYTNKLKPPRPKDINQKLSEKVQLKVRGYIIEECGPSTRIYFKKCIRTNKTFCTTNQRCKIHPNSNNIKQKHHKRTKSGNDKALYRYHAAFKINLSEYPELINPDLYTKGWYRPKNDKKGYNPEGMTWDHLYRISDGYKNNISPDILGHPANAEMISWKENVKRKISQITLEELLLKIKEWDNNLTH